MNKKFYYNLPKPGLRNIKTALSVFICLCIYDFLQRDGIVLALVAAVICMQGSVEKSIKDGANRVIGTIFGGIFGIIYSLLGFIQLNHFLHYFLISITLVIIIYSFNLIKKNDSVTIGCIVFLIIAVDTTLDTPLRYSIDRIINTIIGIVVSILVNKFLFNPTTDRVSNNRKGENMDLYCKIFKSELHKITKWSGGETKELFIYPTDSSLSERNFKWRISSATVDVHDSNFTKFDGYNRHLMVLKGKVRLIHENEHQVDLNCFETDYFSGDWNTQSIGICTDYNLILRKDYEAEISTMKNDDNLLNLQGFYETSTIYSLYDNVSLQVYDENNIIIDLNMSKDDFVLFEHLDLISSNYFIKLTQNDLEKDTVIAVSSNIKKSI